MLYKVCALECACRPSLCWTASNGLRAQRGGVCCRAGCRACRHAMWRKGRGEPRRLQALLCKRWHSLGACVWPRFDYGAPARGARRGRHNAGGRTMMLSISQAQGQAGQGAPWVPVGSSQGGGRGVRGAEVVRQRDGVGREVGQRTLHAGGSVVTWHLARLTSNGAGGGVVSGPA